MNKQLLLLISKRQKGDVYRHSRTSTSHAMKSFLSFFYCLFFLSFSTNVLAQCSITRTASNSIECTNGKTFGIYYSGGYYTIQNGRFFEYSNGTAKLTGTSELGSINVKFSGRTNSGSPESGRCNLHPVATNWYYYNSFSGTLGHRNILSKRGTKFQIGNRANLHNSGFGGSGWFSNGSVEGDFIIRLSGNTGDLSKLSPSISLSKDGDLSCNQSSVTLSATVSTGVVDWNTGERANSITVSSAGTYTATVITSGGCTKSASITVSENDNKPTITSEPENTTACEGEKGTFCVSATGSGLSYQWQWSSDGSSLGGHASESTATQRCLTTSNDFYYFRVRVRNSGGCEVFSNWVKLTRANPSITSQPENTTACEGEKGTFCVSATGSGLSYQWQWSSDGSSLGGNASESTATQRCLKTSNDFYYFRVRVRNSGGCEVFSNWVKLTKSNPEIIAAKSNDLSCNQSSATLTANTSGGTVQWSNGQSGNSITVSSPGTYTATVTASNGCTASSSVTVSGDTNLPLISLSKSGDISCEQTTVTLTANVSNGTVQWSNGQSGNSITVNSAGTYTATVTASNGCMASNTITVNGQCAPKATVGNQVWNDLDNDGQKDPNEPGIGGVTVKLQAPNGTTLQTTTTDNNGFYSFTNLDAGDYKIMFNSPSGFNNAQRTGFGDNNQDDNNDNNPSTGMTDVFTLSPGETNNTIDAGFVTPPAKATVGNQVWNDLDNDGQKDPNEPGIGGVTVKLQAPNGTTLQTTTTDNNGFYSFANLDAGDYKIMFNSPSGFNNAPRTGFGDNNQDDNNDNNPSTGMTDVFTLSSGETNNTIDAGFVTQSVCDNFNFGGKIGFGTVCAGSVEICSTDNAAVSIRNCQLPSGGSGATEYIWLKNEVSCDGPTGTVAQMLTNPGAYNWKIVPNSNTSSLDLSNVSTSTCFMRCARRVGCDRYLGESNIVRIEVNANCGGGNDGETTETCGNGTSITYGNGSITMAGGVYYQIFDMAWQTVFNCGWQCGNSQTVSNLSNGDYRVIIKDVNYNMVCEKVITLSAGGGTDGGNTGGGTDGGNTGGTMTESCDGGISITYGNGSIKMDGGSFYQVLDAGWNEVYNCGWQCGSSKTVNGLDVGEYRIYIKDANYNVICEKVITLSAGGSTDGGSTDGGSTDGGSTDGGSTDGGSTDGGSTDGGSTDGGSTDGGNSISCGEVNITYNNGTIDMMGQDGKDYYFKINDLDNGWAQVFGCGWNCGHHQVANNIPNGKYLITIRNGDWSPHCDVEITISGSSFTSSAGNRNAPQLNFEAFRKNRMVELQWLTNSGYKVSNFEIEHSADGENFTTTNQFVNKLWSNDLEYHQTIDQQPTQGDNYYRVKEIYLDGSFAYTDVKKVGFDIDLESVSVFPNPAQEKLFVNLKAHIGKKGNLTLMNQFGQAVKQINLTTIQEDLLRLNTSSLGNGLYYLNIEVEKQRVLTKKVLIQRLY